MQVGRFPQKSLVETSLAVQTVVRTGDHLPNLPKRLECAELAPAFVEISARLCSGLELSTERGQAACGVLRTCPVE